MFVYMLIYVNTYDGPMSFMYNKLLNRIWYKSDVCWSGKSR